MNFDFTEEQILFRDRLKEAAERLIKPGYMERWGRDEISYEAVKILKEMGLIGLTIPEEYGGDEYEISCIERGIIHEVLGYYDIAYDMYAGNHFTSASMINGLANDELKKEWLPKLAAGEVVVGYCFVEPGTGSDMSNMQTNGVLDGDYWVINGAKASVSFCQADAHIVAVRTNDQPGSRGISLFFIPDNLEGVEHFVYSDFGMKQLGRGDIAFKNVRVPKEYMMGTEGRGFANIMHIFDHGRAGIALQSIACAQSVMDLAYDYCKQRTVFGQPLAKFEAISFGLAEYQTKLDMAKMMAYKALWLIDEGRWSAKESAQSKFFGCEAAFDATWFATRTFGHLGYTSDYPALNKLADIMGNAWADGSWEVCKMVTIRDHAGTEFLPYERRQKASYKVMKGWEK